MWKFPLQFLHFKLICLLIAVWGKTKDFVYVVLYKLLKKLCDVKYKSIVNLAFLEEGL